MGGVLGWRFQEWKAFYELDPDDGERNSWGLAHVVQAIVRNGKPLSDFMLPFGDVPRVVEVAPKQPLAFQEMLIDGWCHVANLIDQVKKGKGATT